MESNPMHVKNVAVIGIYVSDLQAAKQFYVNDMGLEEKGDMGPGCILGLGETTFYLEAGRNKNPENQKLKAADITICFEVESVKAAYAEVEKSNIRVAMVYTEYTPEYAVFMIADPDGNVIEFTGNP